MSNEDSFDKKSSSPSNDHYSNYEEYFLDACRFK